MHGSIAALVALPVVAGLLTGVLTPVSAEQNNAADATTGRGVPGVTTPSAVKRWHYQLQGIDPHAIASSPADMAVIDAFNEDSMFSRKQVDAMRRKPDGSRRIVLAYMSIGEAENYRWYWPRRSTEWLAHENKKWPGNFAVRFWHPDWQAIVFDYLNKIVAAGFDGVYLDRVDIFEEMGGAHEMVDFVERISQRSKAKRSGFLVISQNGDALIPDRRFRRAIDGFAREDLFYGEIKDGERNDPDSIDASIDRLHMLAAEGKPVFVVEYPRDDEQAKTAQREIAEQSFIGLLATRALDRP
jgi:cysteinyl-tRNA synthetase, unknown class